MLQPWSVASSKLLVHGAAGRASARRVGVRVVAMAKGSGSEPQYGVAEKVATVGGLVSGPVVAWSLYTLKMTGCGLPPGPGGLVGGLEGVSYLCVVGIVGWSLYTKARSGSGLPSGPYGLLGAVEGLSYLALVGIAVVLGLLYFDNGFAPGDQCFG